MATSRLAGRWTIPLRVTAALALALAPLTIPAGTARAAWALSLLPPRFQQYPDGFPANVLWTMKVCAEPGGYTGTVHFTTSDQRPEARVAADYTFAGERCSPELRWFHLVTLGVQTITATDTRDPTITATIEVKVVPGSAAKLAFEQSQPSRGPDGVPFSPQPVVRVQDLYGNLVTAGGGWTISLSLRGASGVLRCAGGLERTTELGIASFSGCHVDGAGAYRLRAEATELFPHQSQRAWAEVELSVAVAPFVIVGDEPTGTWVQGVAHRVGVYRLRPDGMVDASYAGTVHFTSWTSSGGMVLPADYTFTAADAGYHEFDVTMSATGPQVLSVAEAGSALVSSLSVEVVAALPAATATLALETSRSTITHGGAVVLGLAFSGDGAGATLGFYRLDRAAASWVLLQTLEAGPAGKASFTDRPEVTAQYLAICEAGCPGGASRIDSNRAALSVRHVVALSPVGRRHVTTVSKGAQVTYRATVRPVLPAARPRVTFFVYQKVKGAWVLRDSITRTVNASGVAAYARRWAERGEWYVRARALADVLNLANDSAIERITVR